MSTATLPGTGSGPAHLLHVLRSALASAPAERELISRLPDDGGAVTRDRPPLLFVHGGGHGAWAWDENWMPEAAARGWRCYALSLRGHGDSDGSGRRNRWLLRDYEKDVMDAVTELPEPPVLVGHSLGAVVVQRILTRYPARAAVLVSPIPVHGGYRMPLRILRRHPTDAVRLALFQPLPNRPDYYFSERLDPDAANAYAERMEPESVLAQIEAVLPRRGKRIAEKAQAPVLVLGGEDDALIDPIDIVKTAQAYETQARMFRGMGHDLMLDAGWRAPLEVMLHWLEDDALT